MNEDAGSTPSDTATPWRAIADRAVQGDRAAYAQLARLVSGYLSRWRAFDFRADWDDIIQEVLVSTIAAHREGRHPTDAALQAYLRQAARFKFVDRIRAEGRSSDQDFEALADRSSARPLWPAAPEAAVDETARTIQVSVRQALAQLDERERAAVLAIHVHGLTYAEATEKTGIPLGTLKRALRVGLASLRELLDAP